MSTFGELVRTLRTQHGMSLEKLAKRIRSHKGYVCGIENAKVAPPSTDVVEKIHKVFADACERQGITLEDFVELAWAEKAPTLIRDRVAQRLGRTNPLFRVQLTGPQVTVPGAHAAVGA